MEYFTLSQFLKKMPHLRKLDPKRIITFADYDLTLAAKDPEDFDKAALTSEQHRGLVSYANTTARFAVVTARGERSSLHYLTEHGELPNTSLASNSGHVYRNFISPLSDQSFIPIPGYAPGELQAVVQEGIYPILNQLQLAFAEIQTDHRELCGAAIYNFLGNSQSEKHRSFLDMAEDLRAQKPDNIRKHLLYCAKHREVDLLNYAEPDNDGGVLTQGYIDIKPRGMDKGGVVTGLLELYQQTITNNPFVVVAGDSSPDYDMMRAVARMVPPENRLFISAGNGLCASDAQRHAARGEYLVDVFIEGPQESPVSGVHELFAALAKTRETKTPAHTTFGVWKAISPKKLAA